MTAVHKSPFAGTWYPENRAELRGLLDARFQESSRRTDAYLVPGALGFIVPHASPVYSGTVAAGVYRAIRRQQPDRIIILGFPHHGRLRGIAAPDSPVIATPLGDVPIERIGGFPVSAEDRLCDHSFEIQLPFLQLAAPGARIVPLYVGRMTDPERAAAASELAEAWEPGTVFLASSDFTHYGRNFAFTPFPSDQNAGRRLRELDFTCIEAAGSVDAGLLLDTLAETGATVCGADPIALLLDVLSRLSPDIYQTVLDYQTSGEMCGDFRHSVSYAGLAYHPSRAFVLQPLDCESLLESAAGTLEQLRRTGKREAVPARGGSPALQGRRGLFVTLSCGDELVGCIGNCQARGPLAVEAAELALSAALDDPRFEPAAARTGPIDVEISVLTPLRRIRRAGSFHVGKHGGLLRLGSHSGLLLPQVAEGHEWMPADFLSALARKSMLGPHAWRDPKARLFVFEAQVFSRPGLRGQS